jgi:cyclic lactone autoinducer peptide
MMKKTLLWLVSALVGLLTFVSYASAASACWWMIYEPKVPAKLMRE